ncbi:MAG: PspA/IM30 family protein [Bacteroidetes bacterium]|nr:MAG: PspA/IM30 family protein [Bacteroidota bacterium]
MKILRRLFKIGQAETHAAVNKLEDPINMIEQGLRDMNENREMAMRSLAEVKAMLIRRNKELISQQETEQDLQNKSMLLLKKAQQGEVDQHEVDELVKSNLKRKAEISREITIIKQDVVSLENQVATLEQNVNRIKYEIKQWENELRTLKARVKVGDATLKINQQMTSMDSSGVVSMLERMREKVLQDEALAEAYGDLAQSRETDQQRMDKKIQDLSLDDELKELKKQMGMDDTPTEK